jgi:hypothetical protein
MTALAEADYLFRVPDDLWPPTYELMANSTARTRWRILKAKKKYITYGENCCQNSKQRACQTSIQNGKVDELECVAMDVSYMDAEFRQCNLEILGVS